MNQPTEAPADPPAESDVEVTPTRRGGLFGSEDWWAIWLGGLVLLIATCATWFTRPADQPERLTQYAESAAKLDQLIADPATDPKEIAALKEERKKQKKDLAKDPIRPWIAKLGSWSSNPVDAFFDAKSKKPQLAALMGTFLIIATLFAIGVAGMGQSAARFLVAFVPLFLLAVVAYVLAGQDVVKYYNLEYALWAILVGLIISNTIGTPHWLQPAVRTEFYIKTGLVLLGAEILFSHLLSLGVPGIFVSWVTTPIVLISTFIFGQKVLKMSSPSLNMVISADMSVCGVSAAIATGAACRAKREELSLAIALSLIFTVIMMVAMPAFIKAVGMDPVLAGAWMGGTIDSTGAVGAAGAMIGEPALTVAATVKMIQNILIGVVAFGVSIYWVGWVEKSNSAQRVGLGEIWRRFPKFMLGFVAASLVFSSISSASPAGNALVSATVLDGSTIAIRGWLFCLAFVSIGLESNFRAFLPYFKGGKPLTLYLVGQSLNLLLSFVMAWLMFTKVFPHAADALRGQ